MESGITFSIVLRDILSKLGSTGESFSFQAKIYNFMHLFGLFIAYYLGALDSTVLLHPLASHELFVSSRNGGVGEVEPFCNLLETQTVQLILSLAVDPKCLSHFLKFGLVNVDSFLSGFLERWSRKQKRF